MPVSTKQVQIEETTYSVTTFNTSDGLKYFRKVLDLFKDTLNPLMNVIDGQEDESLGQVVSELAQRMGEEAIEDLLKEMIGKTTTIGSNALTGATYEVHFAGNYNELFRLMFEILRINYSSMLKLGATNVVVQGS